MEIVLGWDELVEMVHRRKLEKAGVTITLDMPIGGHIWMVPGTADKKAAPLYDPMAEEARLMMKVIDDALEKGDVLPPRDAAILRDLADELRGLLV
jgi:hypothetical protein